MFEDEERLRAQVARLKSEPIEVDPTRPTQVGGPSWGEWARPSLQELARLIDELQDRLWELAEGGPVPRGKKRPKEWPPDRPATVVPLATDANPGTGMARLAELREVALDLAEQPGRGGRRAPVWHALAVAAAAEHWTGSEDAFAPACAAPVGLSEAEVRTARASELPPDEIERYFANYSGPRKS